MVMNLAACGGTFSTGLIRQKYGGLTRLTRFFIYPDYPVYPVKKWDFLYYQVKMVAEHFKRDPTVISRGIRKVEKKRGDEKAFDSRVSKVEEDIEENKNRKIVN